MYDTITIGSSDNPEAKLTLTIGKSVSTERIMNFVRTSAEVKEKQRLITAQESADIIREAEEKLKRN